MSFEDNGLFTLCVAVPQDRLSAFGFFPYRIVLTHWVGTDIYK